MNAYQGFSKQNYTMLDNLKLGYGGTKEEMERLLNDAEKIKAAQGDLADYSIDSYADIIDAIHVVQTEMDITGTTAREAAETVSGSLGMLRAAWANLVTGLGDPGADMDRLIQNFADSLVIAAQNLIPVIARVVWGMVDAVFRTLPDAIIELVIPAVLGVAVAFSAMSVAAGGGILAVIKLIVLLIGFIYSYAASIARSTGVAKTGFGVIAGAVNVVIQFVVNLGKLLAGFLVTAFVAAKTGGTNAIRFLVNMVNGMGAAVKAVAENIGTFFENGFHRARAAAYSFVSVVAGKLLDLANLINRVLSVFDVQIDTSGLSSIVSSTAQRAAAENSSIRSYQDVKSAFQEAASLYGYDNVKDAVSGAVTWSAFEKGWDDRAFQAGAAWGDAALDKLKGTGGEAALSGGGTAAATGADLGETLAGGTDKAVAGIGDAVNGIASDTADLRDAVGASSEELKLLREIAEKQAVNRFTTAEIKVEMTNHNSISSDQDLDGIVRYLEESVEEALVTAAEGVHV